VILLLAQLALAPVDTVRLGPGIHPGPMVISRPTVLLGAPGAVLRGNRTGSVLTITARGTVVRGLRIERSGRNLDRDDAGVMVRADSVVLEDLVIRDMLFGVYLREVHDVVLHNLDIEGPAGLPESRMGDGIHFFHSRKVSARNNRIAHTRDGMYFAYSDSVVASGNLVTQVRFGLHYMFSHENRFEANRFTGNAAGAVIMNSNGVVVKDNLFADNQGSRSYGLVLQTSSRARVEGNRILRNGIGVFLDNAVRDTLRGNLIAGNWLGLQLFPNSEGTVLSENSVEDNTFDTSGGKAEGAYQLCFAGRGNYWSKAARQGYDLDGDGLLDAPYATSSPAAELAREREDLRLLLETPAARVLDWAERSFPVFEVEQVTDDCPLAVRPVLAAEAGAPAGLAIDGEQVWLGILFAAVGGVILAPVRRRHWGRP
jgi:nitrous oxidase accessory protein